MGNKAIKHETHFHGPAMGPVHSGRGDIVDLILSGITGGISSQPVRLDYREGRVLMLALNSDEVIRELPEDLILQRISASVNTILRQLALNYDQARQQSQQWSRVSIMSAGIGFLILAGGIIALFSGYITPGLVTAAVGALTEGATVLLFQQARESNKRVDENQRNLEKTQKLHDSIALWERMKPGRSRDHILEMIIREALGQEEIQDAQAIEQAAKKAAGDNEVAKIIGEPTNIQGTVQIKGSNLRNQSGDIAGVKVDATRTDKGTSKQGK